MWSSSADSPLADRAALGRLICWHEPFVISRYVDRVADLSGRRMSKTR